MLVVIAIGGKGLLGAEDDLGAAAHRAGARTVVEAIAGVARHHNVVVTHGSAPQVGLLAYQSALSRQVSGYPLDIAGAEAQGLLGYLLQQALQNELRDREVVTLLTQVQVDPASESLPNRRPSSSSRRSAGWWRRAPSSSAPAAAASPSAAMPTGSSTASRPWSTRTARPPCWLRCSTPTCCST